MRIEIMIILLLLHIDIKEQVVVKHTYEEVTLQVETNTYINNMKRNNPFNIRVGNNWQGEKDVPEKAFEEFTELDYGLRAGFILLRNYANNYSLTTIEQIVYRFAPPIENNTENYIRVVCKMTGYDRDQELNLWDKGVLLNLAGAMIYMEQGIKLSPLDKAYDRFFS